MAKNGEKQLWRIADEVIERIKTEVSLERLVERFGVELKPHGADKGKSKSKPAITSAATVPGIEKVESEKVEGAKVKGNAQHTQVYPCCG